MSTHLDKLDVLVQVWVHSKLAQLWVGPLAAVAPCCEVICSNNSKLGHSAPPQHAAVAVLCCNGWECLPTNTSLSPLLISL